ncbi:MAG: response regulator [Pseudomonadota bacterium]
MPKKDYWNDLRDKGGLNVVVVDDDPRDLAFVKTLLSNDFRVHDFTDPAAALQHCTDRKVDCVITDYLMANCNGLTLLNDLRRLPHLRYTPTILLSGYPAFDIAVQAFRSRADNYLDKDSLSEHALVYAVKSAFLEKRLEEANDARLHALIHAHQELTLTNQTMHDNIMTAHQILSPLLDNADVVPTRQIIAEALQYLSDDQSLVQPANPSADRINLNAVVDAVSDIFSAPEYLSHIHIKSIVHPIDVVSESNALQELMTALLQRCMWYAADEGEITLKVDLVEDDTLIELTLTGRGESAHTNPFLEQIDWYTQNVSRQASALGFKHNFSAHHISYAFRLLVAERGQVSQNMDAQRHMRIVSPSRLKNYPTSY